jgi:hypothetical protein
MVEDWSEKGKKPSKISLKWSRISGKMAKNGQKLFKKCLKIVLKIS